ncbi:MAG: glycosyltransferase [Pseudomonadota bacterium]
MIEETAIGRLKVSICMLAYNHQEFIGQAVESVLAQSRDFDIELVIGDDASSDDTSAILRRYQREHPDQIKLRVNPTNMGMMGNLEATLSECTGLYIAMLEGDDYWSDPQKLAKQVKFLENNREFAVCFHPVRVLENNTFKPDRFTLEVPSVTSINDLAKGNYIHTCSVVYRTGAFSEYPASFKSSTVGDYFMHMLFARHGLIKKLPDTMAVYRVHSGGVWSAHHNLERKITKYLECMIGTFEPLIDSTLRRRHAEISTRIFLGDPDPANRDENVRRCILFGSEYFTAEMLRLHSENKMMRLSPIRKVVTRIHRSLTQARTARDE